MRTIKNSMRYLQLGIEPKQQHNYALRKWQRALWYITLYIWRLSIVFAFLYLMYKLIY